MDEENAVRLSFITAVSIFVIWQGSFLEALGVAIIVFVMCMVSMGYIFYDE